MRATSPAGLLSCQECIGSRRGRHHAFAVSRPETRLAATWRAHIDLVAKVALLEDATREEPAERGTRRGR